MSHYRVFFKPSYRGLVWATTIGISAGLGYVHSSGHARPVAISADDNVEKFDSVEQVFPVAPPPNAPPPPNPAAKPNVPAETQPIKPKEKAALPPLPNAVEDAVLTFAPEVPPPLTRRYPATVNVNLVTDSGIS